MKLFPRFLTAVCASGLLFLIAATTSAEEKKPVDLKVGDKAPVFKSVDDQGKKWNSVDVVGKKIVVVYFYPADLTGGCTKQACGFRDDSKKLQSKDVEVIGVSGDSVENHQLFKKVHKLNFTLLADENGSVAKAFGVPVKEGGSITREFEGESFVLKRGVTAQRWTFVIDKSGKIVHKDTSVKAAEDSQKILKLVADLQK